MSLQLGRVVGIPNAVHVGGITVEDGVTLLDIGKTPSIVDAEHAKSAVIYTQGYNGYSHQTDLVYHRLKALIQHLDRRIRHDTHA